MSFIEFMLTHTEYQGVGSLFGLGRVILWLLVQILVWLCSLMEGLYNHIFSLFNIVYSNTVVDFIQNWIGFLWIPIAISIIILGYNLMMGEEADGSVRLKTFGRNLCLLMLIIFGLPYLFIGHAGGNKAAVWTDPSQGGYNSNGNITNGNPALIDFFTNDKGQGLINGVSYLAGGDSSTSHTYQTVVKNIYDLKSIYQQVCDKAENGGMTFNSDWSDYLNTNSSNRIYPNGFYKDGKIRNGSAIMGIETTETIRYDDVNDDDEYSPNLKAKDIVVNGYDIVELKNDDNAKKKYDTDIAGNKPNADTSDDIDARQYLFKTIHQIYQIDTPTNGNDDGDGTTDYVLVNNEGKTKTDAWFIDIGSTYPFRYYIEWGLIFITLVTSIAVLFLTSYKIARIIYEITVNQLLALLFGASDLSNGQRVKEILKSIFSLIASLLFAVILVEFYYMLTGEVGNITFVDDANSNNWIRSIACLFIGMATIKGPSVLEKVLGIDGGLSNEWRDVGALNRMTRPVRRAATSTAKLAGKIGAGTAIYKWSKHKGKQEAKKEREKNDGTRDSVNSSNSSRNVRNSQPGDASQFSAARNGTSQFKENHGVNVDTKDFSLNRDASGENAATKSMAGQGRDIAKEIDNKTSKAVKEAVETGQANSSEEIASVRESANDRVKTEVANKYKSNIQNAALAEQKKSNLDDKSALEKAYEGSGFTHEEAQKLASRDITDGSYTAKKDDFSNSISAAAKQKMQDSPLNYSNQMEAYQEAAKEHYQALGFNTDETQSFIDDTANKVCLEDNQTTIRNEAKALREKYPDTYADDTTAIKAAIQNTAGGTIGFDTGYGNLESAADTILQSGTLKEGVVRGRVADNVYRENIQPNSRSNGLNSGFGYGRYGSHMSPTAVAASSIVLGYMGARSLEMITNVGYESGKRKYDKKAESKMRKRQAKVDKDVRK